MLYLVGSTPVRGMASSNCRVPLSSADPSVPALTPGAAAIAAPTIAIAASTILWTARMPSAGERGLDGYRNRRHLRHLERLGPVEDELLVLAEVAAYRAHEGTPRWC